MLTRILTTTTTYTLLAAAGGVSLLLPNSLGVPSAMAHSGPDIVQLSGVVYDFRKSHPDFNNNGDSIGHVAGNVSESIGGGRRPVYVGNGFKVKSQWRKEDSTPISPSTYLDPNGTTDPTVPVVTSTNLGVGAITDTFNSRQGPYRPRRLSPMPQFQVSSVMPAVEVPMRGFGMKHNEKLFDKGKTTHYRRNKHMNVLTLSNGHTIMIHGKRVVRIEEELRIEAGSKLELARGAELDLYLETDAVITGGSLFNVNTADPSRVRIYKSGAASLVIENESHVYATVVSPEAPLEITDEAHFYGKFTGHHVSIGENAGFHLDTSGGPAPRVCGVETVDREGTRGQRHRGAVTSAATFDQWFRPVLGTNLSRSHAIQMVRNGDVYEHNDATFFPIDGGLYGNEGQGHNTNFTYSFSAWLTYDACTGQFIEFQGTDDAWGFVDGRLAIDLGGLGKSTTQVVDLDRMGLENAESYRFDFFFANRQSSASEFKFRTNVRLTPVNGIAISAGFD